MGRLPDMPYSPRIIQNGITRFLGINKTENSAEGELADSLNLTTDKYPALASACGRLLLTDGNDSITDFFEWDGHEVRVNAGGIYFDGEYKCEAAAPQVQCAVVNTKLFIIPGNIQIDLETGEAEKLKETYTVSDYKFVREGDDMKLTVSIGGRTTHESYGRASTYNSSLCTYCYGMSIKNIQSLWNDETGWNTTELRQLQNKTMLNYENGNYVGKVIIPKDNGGIDDFGYPQNKTAELNTTGEVAVITEIEKTDSSIYVYYRIISSGEMPSLTLVQGDAVNITGTSGGLWDLEKTKPSSIEVSEIMHTVTLTFSGSLFPDVDRYSEMETEVFPGERWVLSTLDGVNHYLEINVTETIPAGSIIYKTPSHEYIYVYLKKEKKTLKYQVTSQNQGNYLRDPPDTFVLLEKFYAASSGGVSISRAIPSLDYICSKDNRVYGVSNEDKTVYVSALGMPSQFYDFNGDIGSYAVAVGSEGEFTAICNFENAVCCFKENRVHKLFGDYSSNFYMSDYELAGVQKGSHRSLKNVNGYLYYKGKDGIYVYGGSYPQRISDKLGGELLLGANGGFDGSRYYFSAKNKNGQGFSYSFDISRGIWLLERPEYVTAYAVIDEAFCLLVDGRIYKTGLADKSGVPFMAQLAPFYENTLGKKDYERITLRVEMKKNAYLSCFIREDGGQWRNCATLAAYMDGVRVIPLRPQRCDRFEIKLEGQGDIILRAIAREYIQESVR